MTEQTPYNKDALIDAASANECAGCGKPLAWGEPDEDFNEFGLCPTPGCPNEATYVRNRISGLITLEEAPPTRSTLYVEGCAFCDRMKATGQTFFPRHVASDRCESGKHAHCACDSCF